MKTERVVFLASPKFKAFLRAEAAREGIGVAELIRRRVEGQPTDEEALLVALTKQLHQAVLEAREAAQAASEESRATLADMRARRSARAQAEQAAQAGPAVAA